MRRLATGVTGSIRTLAQLPFLWRVDALRSNMQNVRIPIVEAVGAGRDGRGRWWRYSLPRRVESRVTRDTKFAVGIRKEREYA